MYCIYRLIDHEKGNKKNSRRLAKVTTRELAQRMRGEWEAELKPPVARYFPATRTWISAHASVCRRPDDASSPASDATRASCASGSVTVHVDPLPRELAISMVPP